jgi:DNA-binding NarL/FixJ family response regulator
VADTPAAPPLHLLVVDDHAVVRMGLAGLLVQLEQGCEVSEAANLGEALAEGAAAWLPKSTEARVFALALKVVLEGGSYVPAGLMSNVRHAGAEALTARAHRAWSRR